jgi:hypothetical protein
MKKISYYRKLYNSICEQIGIEVDYNIMYEPTKEEFDKLRHDLCNFFKVPYDYIFGDFDEDDLK